MRNVVFMVLVCMSMSTPFVTAAQLDAVILADGSSIEPSFQFLKVIYIQYPDGGELSEILQGMETDHIIYSRQW